LSTRTSVIRSYQRATQALERAVEAARQVERRDAGEIGYFSGRPPYGYKVEDGRFVINREQADAVKSVFSATLAGKNGGEIIKLLSKRSKGRRREYWDRKKIHRILGHASLYCTGTYHPKQGPPVVIIALAFLPSLWLTQLKDLQGGRLSLDQAAPIPSLGQTGTMGANPSPGVSP